MKRALLEEYRIDGKKMLAPDEGVTYTCSDLVAESARDEAGYLHRVILRHDMRSWEFSYAVLTTEEYQYITDLLKGKSEFVFEIVNTDGEAERVKCYCEKKTASFYSKRHGLYKNLKFAVVEY